MFAALKALPGRAHRSTSAFMTGRLGFSDRQVHLTWYYLNGLLDQVLAVIPISLLQILVLAIFFQQGIQQAGLQVMGLFLAIIGLTLFLDGLRVAIMPLAEVVGMELPERLHMVFVLLVAGFLGILVTYAEPAIAALRPLARLVDPARAPYLYYLMNQQQELMVFAIGAGVGVAAIIGTLRFLKDWPLKPIIYATLAPTVAAACYMQWGNPDLAPLIGVAWDCGGVTTGPVTVPVLLALGVGVMGSSRKRRLARAALEGSVAAGAGQALEGFGIVTLASLFPILAVQLMAIIDGAIYSHDYVLAEAQKAAQKPPSDSAIEKSPLREVVYAVRSIMPLVIVLVVIVLLILRRGLPECSFWVDPPPDDDDDASVKSSGSMSNLARASLAIAGGLVREGSSSTLGGSPEPSEHGSQVAALALSKAEGGTSSAPKLEPADSPAKAPPPGGKAVSAAGPRRGWFARNAPLLGGVAFAQIGMILFNIGLTYGFTKLGDQTGTTLPAAYLEVPWLPKSPYYSYAGGLILLIVVVFSLGVLATRAEPALNVLGRTVERLSGGSFTAKLLIGAVCLGVGIGMAVGGIKILYNLPIIYFILGKYTVAVVLTAITDDAITAVAWDSAGVTTGPVTVPFVLSIGIGFAMAVNSTEGFGMLTIASVAPIITVLLTAHLRKPAANAREKLSRQARSLNRSFATFRMKRRLKRNPSAAMAAFAADAGASAGPTPDPSHRGGRLYNRPDEA